MLLTPKSRLDDKTVLKSSTHNYFNDFTFQGTVSTDSILKVGLLFIFSAKTYPAK